MSQFFPPSNPLATLFHGSVTIEPGCDHTSDTAGGLYGFGDLFVSRQIQVGFSGSPLASSGPTSGSLVVHGGMGVLKNANLALSLNVLGTTGNATNLRETHIDTTWGPLTITGGNQILMSIGDSITFATTNSGVTVSAANTIVLESNLNASNAIQLTNKNAQGGIKFLTGEASGFHLTTGSGGAVMLTSAGNITLTANNGDGSFTVNTSQANQNLTLNLTGDTNSGILIQSSGKNTSIDAIAIKTLQTGGNIVISNSGGNSNANIQLLAGSTGIIGTTNTGGPIQLTARDAASYFVNNTVPGNNARDLRIAVDGMSDSSLVLESEGTSSIDSIILRNTNTQGSMLISNATAGSGGMSFYTGSGGYNVATLFGSINMVARGASSSFINQTTADSGQDLTICVKGVYSSAGVSTGTTQANKLILCSESISGESISLRTSGGTYISSQGQINIQTSDTGVGINIGTTVTVPVNIGTATSTTTIRGNLDVQGTTTTYDSTIVQIADNFIQVNNQPTGLSTLDGGLAIKRYQPANHGLCSAVTGSIISDAPEYSGTVTGITSGSGIISVSIPTTDFSTANDAYVGYWIKMTYHPPGVSTTNDVCWVRRIKDSTSTASTGVFTIYSTLDQTTTLGSPVPIEGLDLPNSGDYAVPSFPLASGATLTFSLYPCHWILSMWDESHKEYALVCTNSVTNAPEAYANVEPLHYVNLHVNDIIANVITVNSINNLTADVKFTLTLTDNSTTAVQLNTTLISQQLGQPYPKFGIFMVLVRPKTAIETSPYAMFVMGRRNDMTSCGQVARIISVKGTNGEMLDMDWPADSYPRLMYRPAPGSASTTDYTLKFITV
jgi:hypothetical protein